MTHATRIITSSLVVIASALLFAAPAPVEASVNPDPNPSWSQFEADHEPRCAARSQLDLGFACLNLPDLGLEFDINIDINIDLPALSDDSAARQSDDETSR